MTRDVSTTESKTSGKKEACTRQAFYIILSLRNWMKCRVAADLISKKLESSAFSHATEIAERRPGVF
jgi:hypothetical protein